MIPFSGNRNANIWFSTPLKVEKKKKKIYVVTKQGNGIKPSKELSGTFPKRQLPSVSLTVAPWMLQASGLADRTSGAGSGWTGKA